MEHFGILDEDTKAARTQTKKMIKMGIHKVFDYKDQSQVLSYRVSSLRYEMSIAKHIYVEFIKS